MGTLRLWKDVPVSDLGTRNEHDSRVSPLEFLVDCLGLTPVFFRFSSSNSGGTTGGMPGDSVEMSDSLETYFTTPFSD